MGTTKQLLPVDNRPAAVLCVENIMESGVEDIVVVINPEGSEIASALSGLPITVAVNRLSGSDMATSVRFALSAVDESATGIFVCLCDHPLVASATLAAMGSRHNSEPGAIIIPVFQGKKGHPTLFPHFVLMDMNDTATLRDVVNIHKERILFLDVADEGTVLDMDTPEDYMRILDRCRS
ncbi:MAG: nucleotidyltransferase family protein [Syntrophales bacterium]